MILFLLAVYAAALLAWSGLPSSAFLPARNLFTASPPQQRGAANTMQAEDETKYMHDLKMVLLKLMPSAMERLLKKESDRPLAGKVWLLF